MSSIAAATALGANRLDMVLAKDRTTVSSFTPSSCSSIPSYVRGNPTSPNDPGTESGERDSHPKPAPRLKKLAHKSACYTGGEYTALKTDYSAVMTTPVSETPDKPDETIGSRECTDAFGAPSYHPSPESKGSLNKDGTSGSGLAKKVYPIPKPRLRAKSAHQSLFTSHQVETKRLSKSLSSCPKTNVIAMSPESLRKAAARIDLSEFDPLKARKSQVVPSKPSNVELLDNVTDVLKAQQAASAETSPNAPLGGHKEPGISGTPEIDKHAFLTTSSTSSEPPECSTKLKPARPAPPAPHHPLESYAHQQFPDASDIASDTSSTSQNDDSLTCASADEPFQTQSPGTHCKTPQHSLSTSTGGDDAIVSPVTSTRPTQHQPEIDSSYLSPFSPVASNSSANSSASDPGTSDSDDSVFGDACGGGGHVPALETQPLGVAAPQQRTNHREGYLLKQGGYNANRGWRKRWVLFNGTSLRYFVNASALVSIHVIPLRCMVKVELDIKDDDKYSFRFMLHTTINKRVFMFASDNRDDCVSWALNLGAAIARYQNGSEETTQIPDKEGFAKVNNWSGKRYVTLSKMMLVIYDSFEDFKLCFPKHEIDLKFASVKVKDDKKLKLQVSTNVSHFDFTFETLDDLQQWLSALKNAIEAQITQDARVMEKVYKNTSNRICADCSVEHPQWAVVNMGIVVCENCAGVHRSFDKRLSKVRSLRMDTKIWTPSLVDMMTRIGNAHANAFWEFNLPPGANVDHSATAEKRSDFIKEKYVERKYCDLQKTREVNELVDSLTEDDVLDVMKCLFSGHVMSSWQAITSAYDSAKASGKNLIAEFLYQNGGDRRQAENLMNEQLEQTRLQGFLNKAGPKGRHFDKRWCVLDHGALIYYANEKSTRFKGTVHRNDMFVVFAKETERNAHYFELSTKTKENRNFLFSSESRDESRRWLVAIAKVIAPVGLLDNHELANLLFAGTAHMKGSLFDEWQHTFLVLCEDKLLYLNRDFGLETLSFNRNFGVKEYRSEDYCFVIGCPGMSLFIQATLARDTGKMYEILVKLFARRASSSQ